MMEAATRPIVSGLPDALALSSSLTDALAKSDLMLILIGVVAVATLAAIAAVVLCDKVER
jgi:hypothetical protein